MSYASDHKQMLLLVANTLTQELLNQVAFVGGCTTGLLITDDYSREQVRYTEDVDLIIHLVGYVGWAQLQQQLQALGFTQSLGKEDPVCAMRLGGLRVDFMPDDEAILGFTNCWYSDALNNATDYAPNDETTIKLVSPVFFVATKLEAWLGRGDNDPLGSHDN